MRVTHAGRARPLGRRGLRKLRRAARALDQPPVGVATSGRWQDCVEPDRPLRTPTDLALLGGALSSIGTVVVWRLLGHDPADVGTIAAWAVAVSMQVVGALLLLGPVEFHSGPGLDTREWTSDGPVWPHRQR